MEIIHIGASELIMLLETKQFPKMTHIQLRKKQLYSFYHHELLYGIYQIKGENDNYYFLKKNRFKPLRLIGNSNARDKFIKNVDMVLNTWKNRHTLKSNLLIFFHEDDNQFHFQLIGEDIPQFIENFNIDKSDTIIQLAQEIHQTATSNQYQTLSTLKNLGRKLYQSIGFQSFEKYFTNKIILQHHSIPSSSQFHNFPLSAVCQDDRFPMLESQIVHYREPKQPRLRLHSFALLSTLEDEPMKKEKEMIEKSFQYKPNFKRQFLVSQKRSDWLSIWEDCDILHIICHGEVVDQNFFFTYNNQSLLTVDDIKGLSKTPSLVFLSSCHSHHPKLIDTLFELGVQTIIVSQGFLFSSNLGLAISQFYWRLLIEKINVTHSFYLMIKKLMGLNDINAIKFKIYGYGREKLFSHS